MTLTLLPTTSSPRTPDHAGQITWVLRPRKIAAGVLAVRDRSGRWTELSGLDDWLLTMLAASKNLIEDGDLLPPGNQAAWHELLTALSSAELIDAHYQPNNGELHILGDGPLADELRNRLTDIPVSLTIVCTDRLEPDRGLLRQLDLAGEPYLVVRADDNWASLGPHVVPGCGVGMCCLDQHAVDDDPTSWQLVLMLSRIKSEPATWISDWMVGQLQAHLRSIASGNSQLIGANLTIDATGASHWTTWQPHPMCCAPSTKDSAVRLGVAA